MLLIAIDGACRRNGKPNCVAAGGVFVQQLSDENLELLATDAVAIHEVGSTSQRGEMLALLKALDYTWSARQSANFITDSEYLFNAMTKQWYSNWERKGWITAVGEPVKNRDLWEAIIQSYRRCEDAGIEMAFYYVKGHCIPFGKVTANNSLEQDTSGRDLLLRVMVKYDATMHTKTEELEHANDLSDRNNGFRLTAEQLKHFVASNLVADAIATNRVDAADKGLVAK
jgi:ribonuclease HI